MTLNSTLERLSAIAGRPLDVRRKAREDGDVLHTGADIIRAREARLRAVHGTRGRAPCRVRVDAVG
jgi:hypothetical protein